jgi:hypothetical protein
VSEQNVCDFRNGISNRQEPETEIKTKDVSAFQALSPDPSSVRCIVVRTVQIAQAKSIRYVARLLSGLIKPLSIVEQQQLIDVPNRLIKYSRSSESRSL